MKMQIFVAVKLTGGGVWGVCVGGGVWRDCLQGKDIGGVQERKKNKEEKGEAPVLALHWKPAKHVEHIYMHGYAYGLS